MEYPVFTEVCRTEAGARGASVQDPPTASLCDLSAQVSGGDSGGGRSEARARRGGSCGWDLPTAGLPG